jgi:hypothetical protein
VEGELRALRQEVDDLRKSRDAALSRMEEMQATLEELRTRVGSTPPSPRAEPAAPQAAGTSPQAPVEVAKEEKEGEVVGTSKERASRYLAERDILERRGTVLLPGGQLVVETGLEYINSERNRIEILGFALLPAIIIGRIDAVEVERDVFRGFLNARYGITDYLQVEANVPYLYREDREVRGATGVELTNAFYSDGLGDVDLALFGQVLRGDGWLPDTVLSMRVRAPTGEDPFEIDRDVNGRPLEVPLGFGHWGVQPGVTFSTAVDPAVLFASFSYQWNLERDDEPLGEVKPGNVFEHDLGVAFALNERLAMSFTLQHRFAQQTEVNGERLARTDFNEASLFVGISNTLNRIVGMNVQLGFGLTDDAADYQLQLRVPLRSPWRFPVPKLPTLPWLSRDRDRDPHLLLADGD